jgi:hypothetical protein
MLSNLLLILGVVAFSLALRSFRPVWIQKLGALGVVFTSFLVGYLLSGMWQVGLFCASTWFLLPWLVILTRIRKLTLPQEKNLRQKAPPNSHRFPALEELTEELEGESFEHVQDAGWDWDGYQQFFRLFYKSADRSQGAICLIDQHDAAFYYLSISSRAKDGRIWTTWNYPFSYSLQLVPQWRVNRQRGDQTFLQLYESHKFFLSRNSVRVDDLENLDPERIQDEIQKDLQAQVAHNLASGVLKRDAEGAVRYSWRGLVFIWLQFLRDLVRLS